jgi:NADPH-dependent 2,4-dienoyl-CoA reductase/sulfur reductase-like enzyme
MAALTRKLPIELVQVVRYQALAARCYATTSSSSLGDLDRASGSSAHRDECDIAIVGGGNAGLALAASLGQRPVQVDRSSS